MLASRLSLRAREARHCPPSGLMTRFLFARERGPRRADEPPAQGGQPSGASRAARRPLQDHPGCVPDTCNLAGWSKTLHRLTPYKAICNALADAAGRVRYDLPAHFGTNQPVQFDVDTAVATKNVGRRTEDFQCRHSQAKRCVGLSLQSPDQDPGNGRKTVLPALMHRRICRR